MKQLFSKVLAAVFAVCLLCSCASTTPQAKCVPSPQTKKIKVGLYIDKGASGCGVFHLASLIAHSPQAELVTLMAQDIRDGKLKGLDVLVMPGGGSTTQCLTIGLDHHDKIKNFIRQGGGYVGTCAGMFNVLQIPRRLHLLPFNRYAGAGGSTSSVTIDISEQGAKVLGIKPGRRVVRYSGGPVAYYVNDPKLEGKGFSLATYKSGVAKNPKHVDKFIGSVAAVYGTFGKGKVVATSFHPEYEEVNHDIMLGCFYAVSGVKMTPVYPQKNFRPVRVGVLATGLNGHGPIRTMIDLERHPDIDVHYIMMTEINKGMLRHLDFLVMPQADRAVVKKYMTMPYSKKVLTEFMDNGGIILAGGHSAEAVPSHRNVKKLPAKVDFKKYILNK